MMLIVALLFNAVRQPAIILRPVGITALTTVLGMIPLLPDVFFVSMAVTIMGGLAFATLLTLLVVPTLYAVMFRIPSPPAGAQPAGPTYAAVVEEGA
jgi:multidrug efflux pump subunit AcrB